MLFARPRVCACMRCRVVVGFDPVDNSTVLLDPWDRSNDEFSKQLWARGKVGQWPTRSDARTVKYACLLATRTSPAVEISCKQWNLHLGMFELRLSNTLE